MVVAKSVARSAGEMRCSIGQFLMTHTVAIPVRESPLALMADTGDSGPVVVDGESFLDALFASAGQG